MAFSPDGSRIAAGGPRAVLLHSTATGKLGHRLPVDAQVWKVAFSPNGEWVAAASGDVGQVDPSAASGRTDVWVAKSGRSVLATTQRAPVLALAFSSDGSQLASLNQRGHLRTWRAPDWQPGWSKIRDAPPSMNVDVDFTADGRFLVYANGASISIWAAADGAEVAHRRHPQGNIWDVEFSPRSKQTLLATAGTDGMVALWLWRPDDLLEAARTKVDRNLTPEEWRKYIGPDIPYRKTFDRSPNPLSVR